MRSLRHGDVLERYPCAESIAEMREQGIALRPLGRMWIAVPAEAPEPVADWRGAAREILDFIGREEGRMTPLLLIVDDDALKARVVERIASRVGWRCQHAPTLASALVHIEHGDFAGAVLDDDMHGYPRGEQMRGACTRVGLPAVIYSGTEGPNRILSTDLDALRVWLTETYAAVSAPGAA